MTYNTDAVRIRLILGAVVYLEMVVGCLQTQEDCWRSPQHQRQDQDLSACRHC